MSKSLAGKFAVVLSIVWTISVFAGDAELHSDLPVWMTAATMPADIERLRSAERMADSWSELIIARRYLPPEDVKAVAVAPGDSEGVDYLQTRYCPTSSETLTLTQTLSTLSILYEVKSEKGNSLDLKAINVIANKLFNHSEQVNMIEGKVANEGTIDPKDLSKGPWFSRFSWKIIDNQRVFFWMIKYDGHPSALVKSVAVPSNRYWFSTPPK